MDLVAVLRNAAKRLFKKRTPKLVVGDHYVYDYYGCPQIITLQGFVLNKLARVRPKGNYDYFIVNRSSITPLPLWT